MDDITEVSSPKETAKVNTVTINRNIEVSPRTFLATMAGVFAGIAVGAVLYSLRLPVAVSAVAACAVGVAIPVMALTTVKDETQQKRWKRAVKLLKSRNIDGGVFFPNSIRPENITELEELVMKR